MKPRRRPPRRLFPAPLRFLSGVVLAAALTGVVYFSRIVTEKERHFAPAAAHPYDWAAGGCLLLALLAGMGMLLDLSDQPLPRRWRKAGGGRKRARRGKKTTGRSGYNRRT